MQGIAGPDKGVNGHEVPQIVQKSRSELHGWPKGFAACAEHVSIGKKWAHEVAQHGSFTSALADGSLIALMQSTGKHAVGM